MNIIKEREKPSLSEGKSCRGENERGPVEEEEEIRFGRESKKEIRLDISIFITKILSSGQSLQLMEIKGTTCFSLKNVQTM